MNYIKLSILALLATSSLMRANYQDFQACYGSSSTKFDDCFVKHCGGNEQLTKVNACHNNALELKKCDSAYNEEMNLCGQLAVILSPEEDCKSKAQTRYNTCFQKFSTAKYNGAFDALSCAQETCK